MSSIEVIKLTDDYQENEEIHYNNLFTDYKGNVSFMERVIIQNYLNEITNGGYYISYEKFKRNVSWEFESKEMKEEFEMFRIHPVTLYFNFEKEEGDEEYEEY